MSNFFSEMHEKYVDKFWPGMCEPVPEDRQDDLAAEVQRLREALRVIAFPRRGTDEELIDVGQYAASFIADPRE